MGSSTSKHPPTFADRVILDQFNSKRTLAEIQIPQLCGYLLLGVPNAAMPILPKRWRRRYFVLIDSRLECYAGNQAKSRLLCTFSIRGCTVESGGVKKKSHLRFGVCSNGVTWLHLIADNEGLKQVWMNAIRAAADPKFSSISRQLVSEVAQSDSDLQASTTSSSKASQIGRGTPTKETGRNDQHDDDSAVDIDAPVFARQVSYDIQTEEEVASTMEATITDAAAAMSLSPVKARALLAGRGWNLSDLISDVLEPSKRTKILAAQAAAHQKAKLQPIVDPKVAALAAAHAAANAESEADSAASTTSDVPAAATAEAAGATAAAAVLVALPSHQEEECLICEEEFEGSEFPQLGCACQVCKTCLTDHATNFIQTEGRAAAIVGCPVCQEPVADELVASLIPGEMSVKWRHFKTLRYVDQNPKVKWCPQGCGRAVNYARALATDVHCPCGAAYCFACDEAPHVPLLCSQAKEWREMSKLAISEHKSELYEDDAAWLMSFTKPCPRCKNPIQKNQGCDHMTCRVVAGGCGFEFCWVCLGTYAGHSSSTCTAELGSERIKKILGDQIEKRGRTHLTKRFEAYYMRHINHTHAAKFAGKTIAQLEDLAMKLERAQWDQANQRRLQLSLGALRSAAQVVLRAHEFLGNAYALSYYLKEDNRTTSDLFHTVRILLEEETEKLHQCVESPKEIFNMVLHRPFVFKKMLHASSMKSREKSHLEGAARVPAVAAVPTVSNSPVTTLKETAIKTPSKEKNNLEDCASEHTTGGGVKDSIAEPTEEKQAFPSTQNEADESQSDAVESVVEVSVNLDANSGIVSSDDAPPLPVVESALETSQNPSFHGTSILEQLQAEDASVRATSTSSTPADEEKESCLEEIEAGSTKPQIDESTVAATNAVAEEEEMPATNNPVHESTQDNESSPSESIVRAQENAARQEIESAIENTAGGSSTDDLLLLMTHVLRSQQKLLRDHTQTVQIVLRKFRALSRKLTEAGLFHDKTPSSTDKDTPTFRVRRYFDEQSGRYYYHDTLQKQSFWTIPNGIPAAQVEGGRPNNNNPSLTLMSSVENINRMRERQARRKEMEARRRVRKQVDQLREIFTDSSIASTQKFTSISNGTFSLAMASMIPGNGTSLKSAIDDLLPADAHLFAMAKDLFETLIPQLEKGLEASDLTWSCSMCTYLNRYKAPNCEMCGTSKKGSCSEIELRTKLFNMPANGWQCQKCTMHNEVNDKLPFGVLVRFRPELVQALFLCKTCATEAPPGQEGSRIIDIIEATAKELAAEAAQRDEMFAEMEASGAAPRCPDKHPLVSFRIDSTFFRCDGPCHSSIPSGSESRRCVLCNYDLCMVCYQHALKHNFEHPEPANTDSEPVAADGGGGAAKEAAATTPAKKAKSTSWSCPLCSHSNGLDTDKCDMCLSEKFLADETSLLATPVL